MVIVEKLAELVAEVVGSYATLSPNATLYHVHDPKLALDTVLVVPQKRQKAPYIVVVTRIEGEHVIIEADTTDRPVDEALMAVGIPRAQIILAYRGEHIAVA